jgi:hypothetical protein
MMPKTWNALYSRVRQAFVGLGVHYGIRFGIVAAGSFAAVRSLGHASIHAARPTLVEALAAATPTNHTVLASSVLERTPKARIAPGGLDAGFEHERITYWVDKFSTTLSSGFERSLARMSKYTGMITAKLDAKKAPRDLIYLAMIESQFDPKAQSPVHAVGMWQFMTETAKRFGLEVGKKVDERKNPARATDAAIAYLSQLHDRFGSWYLAAAAYNSGEGTVQRALERVLGRKTGTDADFFRILPALPRETQDYVPKLIASARVGNAPSMYGLTVGAH